MSACQPTTVEFLATGDIIDYEDILPLACERCDGTPDQGYEFCEDHQNVPFEYAEVEVTEYAGEDMVIHFTEHASTVIPADTPILVHHLPCSH